MKKLVTWLCSILSLVSGVVYLLTGADIIPAGNIREPGEGPPVIFFVAGAYYIIVAWVLRLERRWLRVVLAVLNALVIIIFFQMWAGRTDVLTSAAGLGTKIPQVLLEIGLIWLAVKTASRRSA